MRKFTWSLCVVAVMVLNSCGGSGRQGSSPPPPTITFVSPSAGDSVHGTVHVKVTASSVGDIRSFVFTAPSTIARVSPALDATSKTGSLEADLDVSSMPDGPVTIAVEATDQFGGVSRQSITVTVSQKAPKLTIGSPIDGTTVKGSINIIAQAQAQGSATITTLGLVDPPAGVGSDQLPSADSYLAEWNSTVALEGTVALHFRATDSSGLSSDQTIHVEVANFDPSVLDVYVSAGAPVAGAEVDVYAIDNATGNVAAGYGAEGLIGSATPTDKGGRASVTITDRNYSGPIRVIARSPNATPLSYIDPCIPANNVSIPTSLVLSTIIANYSRGQSKTVPVTLYTTLADAELLAYAGGVHRLHNGQIATVKDAAAYSDSLFAAHLQPGTPRWDLRSSLPASLSDGPSHSLSDADYAAFGDVALGMLAHDLGVVGQVGNVITAPYLLEQVLIPDLEADGQFDGFGESGVQLYTYGSPRQKVDANTMRVALATALDEFMRSTRNLSGISHDELNRIGLYDAMSTDRSELFNKEQAPKPFDNAPPDVSVGISYDGGKSPVGNPRFVRGLVTVTVDASDPGGVSDTSVWNGASRLTKLEGSTATHYVATFDSTVARDGLVTLTVKSVDALQNSGATTVSFTIDNTPPTINATAPDASAFYSTSVPFYATSSDGAGSGVASLTTVGFQGIANTGAAGSFVATWALPSGTSDGLFPGSTRYQACDLVGNCATAPIAVTVDQSPPVVEATTLPSTYSRADVATVRVHVSDSVSGVSGVFGRSGSTTITGKADPAAPGYYDLTFQGLALGRNVLSVWAVDRARNAVGAAPNTGDGRGAPYALSRVVVYTYRSLNVSADSQAGAPTYVDESGAVVSASGVSSYADMTRRPVLPGGVIHKIATRAGWATQPSAADLEGTNTYNIPTMRVAVDYDPALHAPITSAVASVCMNSSCTNVNLWPSAAPPSGKAAYLLPLASNLLPDLAVTTSSAISISVALVDSVGNTGSANYSVTYDLLGAPLAIAEDTNYPTSAAGDQRSIYYYSSPRASVYQNLWTVTPFAQDNGVRVLHYVVINPWSLPVALRVAFSSSAWSTKESWNTVKDSVAPSPLTYSSACAASFPAEPSPCSINVVMYKPASSIPVAGSGLLCARDADTSAPPSSQYSNQVRGLKLLSVAYGADGGLPGRSPGGRYVVPAGGRLDLYVLRPIADRSYLPELTWNYYSSTWAQFVVTNYTGKRTTEGCSMNGGSSGGTRWVDTWTGTTWNQQLSSASESVAGTLVPYTTGYSSGLDVGAETSYGAISFERTYSR